MKFKIFSVFFSFLMLVGFVSCLGDDSTTTTTNTHDAQIYAFSMSSDNISELSEITFSIDQLNGLIYNSDSLAYDTDLSKVLCSITVNSASAIVMRPEATGDTITWASSDSIDFSKPVMIDVYSSDGTTKKTYTAQLNVHQQEGNQITWTRLTNRATNRVIYSQKTLLLNDVYCTYISTTGGFAMYTSLDGKAWTEQTLADFPANADLSTMVEFQNELYLATKTLDVYESSDGRRWSKKTDAPTVKTFLGNIPATTTASAFLCAILNIGGEYYWWVSDLKAKSDTATVSIPANFPISGFGAASNYNADARYTGLIVAGGRTAQDDLLNTTWRTSDGLQWVQLGDEKATNFNKKEGVSLAYYDDKYYLIGGRDANDTYYDAMFVSVTNGVTWIKADTLNTMTDLYSPRANASIIVKDNHLMLFGGTNSNSWFDDVWSGFLNKLGFKVK